MSSPIGAYRYQNKSKALSSHLDGLHLGLPCEEVCSKHYFFYSPRSGGASENPIPCAHLRPLSSAHTAKTAWVPQLCFS